MGHINQNEAGFWRDGTVISGAPLTLFTSTAQFFGGYFFQNPGALGDEVEFTVNLTPGDYRLSFFGAQTGASGIQDVFFDGALVATFDHYISGPTNFDTLGVANVTVIQKDTVIRAVIVGQNASSVGFNALVTRIFINAI